MRVMLIVRSLQDPLGHTHDVIPKRLPLVLLVPDIRPLEQRDNEPLWLHEDHLRRPDLSLQWLPPSSAPDCRDYAYGAVVGDMLLLGVRPSARDRLLRIPSSHP